MDSRAGDLDSLAQALRAAASAQQRAANAGQLAERHEKLIAVAPVARCNLHERMAKLLRETQWRHITAAEMYRSYAGRLRGWMELPTSRWAQRPGLMAAVTAVAGSSSAAVSLIDGDSSEAVFASDSTAEYAQELEFTLGEGPSRDCLLAGPLLASGPEIARRWGVYGPALEPLGVGSVAAVPLGVDGVKLGSLVVFGEGNHAADERLPELLRVGGALVDILFAEGDGAVLGAVRVVKDANLRTTLHQAAGAVAGRRGCSVTDALALMRAYAFAENLDVCTVARDVLEGHVQFDD